MNRKYKVLIVDDLDSNRELLKILCESRGMEAVEAENGKEAIELALKEKPALILMDVMMPVMNGYDATEILKSQPETKHIPIIMITSLDEREQRIKGIEKGANDFLGKPIDIKELQLRIHNNLQFIKYKELLENYNENLKKEVEEKTKEAKQAFENVDSAYKEAIQRLSLAAEFKDPETGAHIQRVSFYARVISEKLGMDKEFTENIYHAAPMHDIGKVGIPDRVLLKEGPLNAEEWKIMQEHTLIGEKILRNSSSAILKLAAEIALTHHEKWNGSGYPYALKGEDIPISGRIMALADVYDALRSKRAYKTELTHAQVYEIMTKGNERTHREHFAPDVHDIFSRYAHILEEIFETHQDAGLNESHFVF